MESLNTRRSFLKKSLYGSLGLSAFTSTQFALVNSALAQQIVTPGGYKALVCIFLYGGNDSFNMFTPMEGQALVDYKNTRQSLARENAIEITSQQQIEGGIGFVPEMASLKNLYDQGKLAIQANVGSLLQPTTVTEIKNKQALLPNQLYSHSSQQHTWQRGAELNQNQTGHTGWAGRMFDLMQPNPRDATQQFPYMQNMSLNGHNIWQSGLMTSPYSVCATDVETMNIYKFHHLASIRKPIVENYVNNTVHEHLLAKEYSKILMGAEKNARELNTQLAQQPILNTLFPENSLGDQLQQVAQLMRIGKQQGLGRQVFFVGMGGFDTHSNQSSQHPKLLATLSDAMASFYNATIELSMEHEVTSFTMSDFGRTLTSNGDGTDHGWGGHQFILGGAVQGEIYGNMPRHTVGAEEDIGSGHMMPTTATEQMFASLASWYGVNHNMLNTLFPNLHNFDNNPNYF